MKENKEKSIVKTEHKSCASLMLQCLNDAGIADRQSGFDHHINNSKSMGLMPDDMRVIRKTMSDYGFVMQGSRLEGISGVEHVLSKLRDADVPTTIFIDMDSYYHAGGYMLALRYDGKDCHLLCAGAEAKLFMNHTIKHIWMRWDDGIDRSPCLRKTVNRRSAVKEEKTPEDTEYYHYFQPNPCGNNIGDCVVRGISGAMNITWNEALEYLSTAGSTTVNSNDVYQRLLEREGFVRHKPMMQGGHRLSGQAFCNEMDHLYHNGERIFAHVGRSHVAAVVLDGSDSKYKIFDSWDSSERLIGEYWVKSVEKPKEIPAVENKDRGSFAIGDTIYHPSFKEGIVVDVTSKAVTVDFGINSIRRLGKRWVIEYCKRKGSDHVSEKGVNRYG